MKDAAHSEVCRPVLLIGYGNEIRGDDAVGPLIAQRLDMLRLPGVRIVSTQQLTPELAEVIAGAAAVVFVDASLSGEPGTVEISSPIPAVSPSQLDHAVSPGTLLALSESLYGHRPIASLVKVFVADCGLRCGLTAEAERAAASALESLKEYLPRLRRLMPKTPCLAPASTDQHPL